MANDNFSSLILSKLLPIYRRHLRGIAFFRTIARELVNRGWISPAALFRATVESQAGSLTHGSKSGEIDFCPGATSAIPGFELVEPLRFRLDPTGSVRPAVCIVLPNLHLRNMTGGPNTALILAMLLAERGESIRLIGLDGIDQGDEDSMFSHMESLLGRPPLRDRIKFVDASDRSKPIALGRRDIFVATAWWTVHALQSASRVIGRQRFVYLIQDFEALLHEASSLHARAIETYSLDHVPVVNSHFLLNELQRLQVGRFALADFASDAICFEPAIDRAHFHPERGKENGRKRLLFYARPTVAKRNLFELGVVALRECVRNGLFRPDEWDLIAMGEPIGAIDLGSNQFLRAAPWMSFNEYAREVRQSDLMLSLMLSPHPSYPPLEMMASGKPVVTNTWGAKTAASLRNLSSNCVPCEPTVSSIVDALSEAATRISLGFAPDQPDGGISAPRSWDESLGAAVDRLQVVIHKERSGNSPFVPASLSSGLLHDSHSQMREIRLGLRRESMSARPTPGLLSFITTVFDTKPEYLFELAACVFDQDGGTAFEWFILDNGSSDPSTIAALRQIAEHPCVRLDRVDRNLGIVGGMRRCLEQATGTYVMPLDSDDLIDPDCVAVIASHITEAGAPAIIYSDEDKASEGIRGIPYHKPDWDPVLLLDSCYVAHLCVFNRQIALDLGVYSSSEAEGCHDWDTMIRFAGAGHLPYHIPEILYSWRIHPQSTAGNIRSKNFIASSHYSTLSKVVRERQLSRIEVEPSPLFSSGVDWRFRRLTVELPSLQLVNVTASKATIAARRAPVACDLTELLLIAESSSAEFIGLVHAGLPRELDEWFASAIAVFELHPDTQVVGGAVVSGERICAGPIVFGFGNGVGSPDQGRSVSDPGYMATMWKHHSCSAITGGNCVVRREFLLATLREIRGHTSIALLGPWLGAMAVRGGFRVVYSPFMSLLARSVLEEECSNSDLAAFIVANSDLLPDTRFYSPRFGLDAKRGFLEVHANERDAHCAGLLCIVPNFHSWQQLSSGSRDLRLPRALQVRSVGAVTTVYEGTSLAAFAELADSLRDQGDSLHSWTVLAHGPIAEDKMDLISRMVRSAGGDLIRHPSPLSIMAAMREAIRGVDTDYFVPVDADDLVLPRGLFAVCSEIERLGLPDCLFTDEAQLVDGVASAPYFRPEFDEVLNLESSYIWHACAIRRDAVERFQLFSDDRSTWCHDWDSISRIWLGGGSIRHSEEVVYLWRRHSESTTNKVGGDRRSLESVRNVLEMIRCTRNTPEAFRVEASPIERGGEELRLGLSGEPSLPIACSLAAAMGRKLPNEGLVIVADPSIQVDGLRLAAEAERLIRLHPRIGAVGFSVANRAGLIVDGCEVVDSRGYLFHPWHGMPHTHAGPYALMLKCQTVFATGRLIAVYRFGALKEAIASMSAVPSDPKAFNSAVRRSFGTGQYRAVFSPAVVPTASAAVNHEYSSTVMAARGPSSGLRRYASVPFS